MGIHEEVTKRILAELEQGTAPWVTPCAVPMPYNAATSRRYNGVNVLLLWNTPYPRPAWVTFHQAQALGGRVRKGEHATPIVYVATGKKPDDALVDDKKKKAKRFPFLTRYFVFNVEQVEGLPKHLYAPPLTLEPNMDAFFSAIPANVRWGPIPMFRIREDWRCAGASAARGSTPSAPASSLRRLPRMS